jgi:hypothetical protein
MVMARLIILALGQFMKLLMERDEANSRFVFLLQGLAIAVSVVMVAAAFVKVETTPDGFVMMMGTLLGGGTAIHFGRSVTKKLKGPTSSQETEKED